MGLSSLLQNYMQERAIQKRIEEDRWHDLVPGDVVEYNGQQYLFRGMNPHGDPMAYRGTPEPVFSPADPRSEDTTEYLRGEDRFSPINRHELERVGHIAPEEWHRMCEEAAAELYGS